MRSDVAGPHVQADPGVDDGSSLSIKAQTRQRAIDRAADVSVHRAETGVSDGLS